MIVAVDAPIGAVPATRSPELAIGASDHLALDELRTFLGAVSDKIMPALPASHAPGTAVQRAASVQSIPLEGARPYQPELNDIERVALSITSR